jgi:hypothetical protein
MRSVMILLVSPTERRKDCAAAIEKATGEKVAIAENVMRAMMLLRTESYTAVVLDRNLMETEPNETDRAIEHLGVAIPVDVNLAISGAERVVREVRAAMRRRRQEEATAREAAVRGLYGEMNGTLTGLMLSVDLALESPGLTPTVAERLHAAHGLVSRLRGLLETPGAIEESASGAHTLRD